MSFSDQPESNPWHPLAAIAAWVLPGLGHFILGQRQRGAILCVTIGVLWLSGMIIGGISVFDHREHPAWFMGQMLMAPSVIMDRTIVTKLKPHRGVVLTYPEPTFEPSFGRVNEQGILYTALAGLLNMLAILDVLYQDTRLRENDRDGQPTLPDEPAPPVPADSASPHSNSTSSSGSSSGAPGLKGS